METIEGKTISVIGLIYAKGKRVYVELHSLKALHRHILYYHTNVGEEADLQTDKLPYYIILENGTTLPYIHYLFHQAFIQNMFSEAELCEALEYSGL